MLHLILFQPEIPQNTGNVGRTCAITGSRLHLIHPLGFTITDRHLKRSGMDYWKELDLHQHQDWEAFEASPARPRRVWMFSTRGDHCLWDAEFADGDGLLFGNEGHGCPEWLHQRIAAKGHRLFIPQPKPGLRSLNLSSAAAVATYEALRQLNGKPEPPSS